MLKTDWRVWLSGSWLATFAVIAAGSAVMGGDLATALLLFALGLVPGIVMAFVGGAPPQTVAEILHDVDTNAGPRPRDRQRLV